MDKHHGALYLLVRELQRHFTAMIKTTKSLKRLNVYGLSTERALTMGYRWMRVFDLIKEPNEPNRFGIG